MRHILLDLTDTIRREPDLHTRVGMTDEFIHVALRCATDLRDSTCYDLMESRVTRHTETGLPRWVQRRATYARRWARRWSLPQNWLPGRPRLSGPDEYVEIALPD